MEEEEEEEEKEGLNSMTDMVIRIDRVTRSRGPGKGAVVGVLVRFSADILVNHGGGDGSDGVYVMALCYRMAHFPRRLGRSEAFLYEVVGEGPP
jgi:hypothetical protein